MKRLLAVLPPLLLCAALPCRALVLYDDPPPPLPQEPPGGEVPFPAWVPAEARGDATGGSTNVLSLGAAWLFAPPSGRPGVAVLAYSNRLDQAFVAERTSSPLGTQGGVLCFALGADVSRTPLPGLVPPRIALPDGCYLAVGGTQRFVHRLPASMLGAAAGGAGLLATFVGRDPHGGLVYWAEAQPLAVPAVLSEPAQVGTNEWRSLVGYWADNGIPHGVGGPEHILADYPEFAPFYPGVVIDATLPEAFRIEFAEQMPGATYDPAVFAFVTNAVDKTSPLVIAALRVLSRVSGATPEQKAAVRAMGDAVRAMSEDAQYPLLFRLHAAYRFRPHAPYIEFRQRTEPQFRLLAADDFRQAAGRFFPTALREEIRTGLTALSTDTTPFVAGPLAGKYPGNATVGQVASIILADLEAKWAAEPPRQP